MTRSSPLTTKLNYTQSGLGLALGAAIDLAGYMHFIRRIVSRLVYHSEGSLCWLHVMPQPAAHLLCSNAVATGRTTSAREAHMRMALEGGVRRGVGPRLLVLMVRLLAERYHRALSRWKHCALCSQPLSLCFLVSATAQHLHCLRHISPLTILGLRKLVYFWVNYLITGWFPKSIDTTKVKPL